MVTLLSSFYHSDIIWNAAGGTPSFRWPKPHKSHRCLMRLSHPSASMSVDACLCLALFPSRYKALPLHHFPWKIFASTYCSVSLVTLLKLWWYQPASALSSCVFFLFSSITPPPFFLRNTSEALRGSADKNPDSSQTCWLSTLALQLARVSVLREAELLTPPKVSAWAWEIHTHRTQWQEGSMQIFPCTWELPAPPGKWRPKKWQNLCAYLYTRLNKEALMEK